MSQRHRKCVAVKYSCRDNLLQNLYLSEKLRLFQNDILTNYFCFQADNYKFQRQTQTAVYTHKQDTKCWLLRHLPDFVFNYKKISDKIFIGDNFFYKLISAFR